MAEKEGFEPSIPFWGIHDFQSCALGQLRDFSMWTDISVSHAILLHLPQFVNPLNLRIYTQPAEKSVDIVPFYGYNIKAL